MALYGIFVSNAGGPGMISDSYASNMGAGQPMVRRRLRVFASDGLDRRAREPRERLRL